MNGTNVFQYFRLQLGT